MRTERLTSKTRTASWLFIALIPFITAACAEKSIFRTTDISGTTSVLTDAKQRVITSTPVTKLPNVGQIDPQRVLCAEPSPDVAQALSDSFSLAIQAAIQQGTASAQGALNLSHASVESIAQLGERLGTIQLLRDKFYRTCEAFANGAISSTTYTLMMSRLDRTMATLLLGEMAAGAFGRTLAAAGGSALAGAGRAADEEKTQKAVDEAQADVDSKQKIADKAGKDAEQAKKDAASDSTKQPVADQKELEAADARLKLQAARDRLDKARLALVETRTAALAESRPTVNIGAIQRTATGASAETISSLHRQFMNTSDLPALLDACITTLETGTAKTPDQAKEFEGKMIEFRKAQVDERAAFRRREDQEKVKALRDARLTRAAEVATITSKMAPSPLGQVCVQWAFDIGQMVEEQIKIQASVASQELERAKIQGSVASQELERARVELCKAAVSSSDPDTRKAGADCVSKTFPKPAPNPQQPGNAPPTGAPAQPAQPPPSGR